MVDHSNSLDTDSSPVWLGEVAVFLRLNAFCDDRKPETAAQCNDHFGNRDIIGIIEKLLDKQFVYF